MLEAPADIAMDFDYMDGLLLDDCWLETADGAVFLHPNLSSFGANLDPLIGWPATEMNGVFNTNLITRSDQEEPRNMLSNEASPGQERVDVGQEGCSDQSENDALEGYELCRRLGMGAGEHMGSAPSVMERLIMAVGYIKDIVRDKDVLVQVWVPVSRGERSVLITNQLPFSQNSSCTRLAKYRDVSVNYEFTADDDSKKALGLPGRVFLRKVPEWTPDVRFFRSDEYPRVDHAHEHDVRGTIALPVFEQGSKSCLGVIEVVMVTQQIKYGSEHEILCKALQAVKLRSSDVISPPNRKVFNRFNEAVLLEIRDTLRTACETHGLPLAQAWASCIQESKEGCRHSDENYSCCVSTVDRACFVADTRIQDFHEACSEHHLLKGEGIVGMAFKSNKPCFSSDITSFRNTDYPLSHHAKLFGLHAAVALRLRCIFISKTDFVLEFFLPVHCRDPEDQRILLSSLSTVIQYSCRNLRLVTDKECREENMEQVHPTSSLLASSVQNIQQCSGSVSLFQELNYDLNGVVEDSEECPTVGNGIFADTSMGRTGEKRRNKVEKSITLEVLRQYFAGSLKDAAKSIGVCPTTLKRICRQHGIKRWPSRKIKKVGHSLQKLRLVIDSVNSASGAFQTSSLYSNLQELTSPYVRKMGDGLKTSGDLGDAASKTAPSSLSQSSNSSQCFSFCRHPATGCVMQTAKESDQMRVKVSYGEERIRFRVQKWWSYKELVKEVGRRFSIRDTSKYELKYLDDECEWVLLTSDAYLQDCFHMYKSSPLQTIKLLLHPSPRHKREEPQTPPFPTFYML